MQMVKGLEVFFIIILYVCVHTLLLAQTIPYISFRGQTLENHSYVDLSLVGDDASGNDSVQCHTDLDICCSDTDGSHRGDWYFPYRTRLPFISKNKPPLYENRTAKRVDLRHKMNGKDGIYRCDIPTNAFHDAIDISVRGTVYVGLYLNGGEHCM